MERSPIKDTEIKILLKDALTNKIDDREIYINGLDASYKYEGYNNYSLKELDTTKQETYTKLEFNSYFVDIV